MSTARQEPQATLEVPEGATSAHETLEGGRYHFRLGMSPEMNNTLERLALRYRVKKADVLNMAVGLLKTLAEAVDEGKRVGIVGDETELETEITEL